MNGQLNNNIAFAQCYYLTLSLLLFIIYYYLTSMLLFNIKPLYTTQLVEW